MPSLTVRPYQAGDNEALVNLLNEAFPDNPPWNAPETMIEQKLSHSPESLLVGISEDGMLAASVMAGYDGRRGWINALAVLRSHRGQSYGQIMVEAALDLIAAQGGRKVNLQITGENTKLEAYYHSLGFITENRISMSIMTKTGKSSTRAIAETSKQ
jgi:ribosomal protein S18 acetylase RimI-like enzyme